MSSPYAQKALENATAGLIMNMFWDASYIHSLQPWENGKRVLHLSENLRSGSDEWFSTLLDQCRVGALDETNYNFLHGFPTRQNTCATGCTCHADGKKYEPYKLKTIADATQEVLMAFEYECQMCIKERLRRARCLFLEEDAEKARKQLTDPLFAESLLITPYNKAVLF